MSKKKHKGRFWKRVTFVFFLFSVLGTILTMGLLSENVATQYPDHTGLFYINDYSSVLTDETERYILEQAEALEKATKAQISVVMVPDTHVDSLEKYSYHLANEWGIGDAELDNGVLILFTTTEPHVRLEIGRGLEGCLTDSKCGRILDTWAVEAKDAGRWNEAALNTFVVVAQEVYAEYGLEVPASLTTVSSVTETTEGITLADAQFPEEFVEENTQSIGMQAIVAFFSFWAIMIVPFVIVCIVLYCAKTKDGVSERGATSYYESSSGSSFSSSSDSSSGSSGGGGSFGGGGASR